MKTNPVGWFEIYVQDMNRAKTFYENVFAFQLQKLESAPMELCSFPMREKGAGAAGALVKMAGFASGGNSTRIYFICDDCAAAARKAKDHGGWIVKEKFSIGPYGFIALVNDSEGNMIGLHSMQ